LVDLSLIVNIWLHDLLFVISYFYLFIQIPVVLEHLCACLYSVAIVDHCYFYHGLLKYVLAGPQLLLRILLQSVLPGILQGDKSDSLLYGSVDNGKKICWNEDFHSKVREHMKFVALSCIQISHITSLLIVM
jgi:hypothetical protein